MNSKKLKKIRRFGRLRFAGDPRYNDKVLIKIYENADPEKQHDLESEMDMYFDAINSGKIKPGESILHLAIPSSSEEQPKERP